jgi:glycosyltransferase involved in cell wall biosynthesis
MKDQGRKSGSIRKILHLSETSESGGSETVLAYIAKNLDNDRYGSLVCLLGEGWLTEYLRRLAVKYTIIENKFSYDPVFLFKLARLIKSEKIDLVHSHEFMMNVYGSVASRLAGVPMIGTIHGKVYFTEKRSRIFAYKIAVAASSRIITVSEDLKKYFMENVGLRSDRKITTIYNGIDLEKYVMKGTMDDLRCRLGIPPDAIIVGTVGSLFKVKGLPYLLKAVDIIKNSFPGIRLLVAGEGHETSYLRRLIEKMNLHDTVTLLGFRDDIPDLLNLFDIYVCSSLSEGLSLSILEAMASGRPVVATRVGGNPELIVDGDNGYLVAPQNPEELAAKILFLISDRDSRERMGNRGRQIAEQKFSLRTMIEKYQNLYEELLA